VTVISNGFLFPPSSPLLIPKLPTSSLPSHDKTFFLSSRETPTTPSGSLGIRGMHSPYPPQGFPSREPNFSLFPSPKVLVVFVSTPEKFPCQQLNFSGINPISVRAGPPAKQFVPPWGNFPVYVLIPQSRDFSNALDQISSFSSPCIRPTSFHWGNSHLVKRSSLGRF